ncbi:hypothetical protein HDF16_002933 [Granulicella aggregans]|uniref:Uncharacterized protein n=1 Tax=Granulicella aggregans TaxID=474949 RepID=A0A7W8E4E3_9BACT|nr:hypothetical protein [Granulicella aggregans]MBB5058219.1 hypothetical protein [Granulicella aggregans]
MVRSVLSILAGTVVLTVASFAIEAVLNLLLLRAFPHALPNAEALRTNLWARAVMFAYGFVCVAAGGYVAARIARRSPMTHAAVLGVIQAGLTVAAMFSPEGNHASRVQWTLTAVLSVPAALAGGALCRNGIRNGE